MPLKLIGTGFGRTGTESMRMALNQLGVGPTHHMHEILGDEPTQHKWLALAQGGAPDWKDLFAGYSACVDWPSAHYWPDLIRAYPDAKVLLTWREPESWWRSYEKTILQFLMNPETPDNDAMVLLRDRVFGGRPDDKTHVLDVYRQNIERVFAEVPAGQLILHRLGDGWGPLCAGLGLPIPDTPYPSSNTTKEFQDRPKNQPLAES